MRSHAEGRSGEPWLWKAVLQTVVFSLIVGLAVAVLGPILAARLSESLREPNCSEPRGLTRVTPTEVRASSELPPERTKDGRSLEYRAQMSIDGDTGTAWVEGVSGLGLGEWVEYRFGKRERFYLLCIVDGYALTWDLYQKNPRIRSIGISTGGNDVTTAPLADAGTKDRFAVFQEVRSVEALSSARVIRLTIVGVYGGSGRQRYADTSLSEVEFWAKE